MATRRRAISDPLRAGEYYLGRTCNGMPGAPAAMVLPSYGLGIALLATFLLPSIDTLDKRLCADGHNQPGRIMNRSILSATEFTCEPTRKPAASAHSWRALGLSLCFVSALAMLSFIAFLVSRLV